MKILFISLSILDQIGGIQNYNQKFIKAMKINKFEYNVVSFNDKHKEQNFYGCNSNIITFFIQLFLLRKNSDLIIWSHMNLLRIFPFVNFFLKGKHILMIYGIEISYFKNWLIKKSLKYIYSFFSISRHTTDSFVKLTGLEKKKVEIFHPCLEPKNSFNNKNPYKENSFNILTIMRLDSRKVKSIINILDAMIEISDISINFTIIGEGEKKELIEEEISNRKLNSNVFMKGYVENTAPYLEYCDLFTLLSDTEGFGIVYLEAMEYEKPCLAAKHCGSEEIIIDEYNGYQIEVDDILNLKDKIIKIKNDKNLRNELGKNGKQALIEKFTFDLFIKKQKKLLSI